MPNFPPWDAGSAIFRFLPVLTALDMIRDALPRKLRETAYVFACEIVLSDSEISQEELRILELIRHRLDIDRLVGAAIERAMAARYVRPGDF